MLILTRKMGEKIIINGNIEIVVMERTPRKSNEIKIGIKAPKEITIHREEIQEKVRLESTLNTN